MKANWKSQKLFPFVKKVELKYDGVPIPGKVKTEVFFLLLFTGKSSKSEAGSSGEGKKASSSSKKKSYPKLIDETDNTEVTTMFSDHVPCLPGQASHQLHIWNLLLRDQATGRLGRNSLLAGTNFSLF